MSKASKNTILRGLSGSIGDLVIRQMPDGSIRVSRKPDFSKRKFSRGQKEHQSRFKQAVAYAREAAKTQPIYAELTRGTSKNAYNLALSDWFSPPTIDRVEWRGGSILVSASDNVRVAEVRITLVDGDGNVLGEGLAVQPDPVGNPEQWEYATDTTENIVVTACDLAGNRVSAELNYA